MSDVKIKKSKPGKIIIVKNMTDYSKDPVSKKRAEEAREFLEKHPLPKSFFEKT